MIKMTEKAIKKFKEIAESEGLSNSIRIKVLGGGCAGFSFDMTFDEIINDMDEVIKQDDIQMIIDSLSYAYLENMEIDYIDLLVGGGFKFNSPDIKGSCGCGKSVAY